MLLSYPASSALIALLLLPEAMGVTLSCFAFAIDGERFLIGTSKNSESSLSLSPIEYALELLASFNFFNFAGEGSKPIFPVAVATDFFSFQICSSMARLEGCSKLSDPIRDQQFPDLHCRAYSPYSSSHFLATAAISTLFTARTARNNRLRFSSCHCTGMMMFFLENSLCEF